ncbi:MAG TPA: histidinol dehydrogenase [Acidimicrobiales bacterium]|nr:histidinol dehydrogenase [Acidimicrobiales bacterium]
MLHTLDLRDATGDLRSLLPRPDLAGEGPVAEVRAIVAEVRAHGDAALREYSRRFDGVDLDELSVPLGEAEAALRRLPPPLREALTLARDNIEAFHRDRPEARHTYSRGGVTIDLLELPVARAGVYAPGGRAKYPSSVLMTAIPPKVAGVGAVALCVPPGPDGRLPDEVLAAASLAGVDEIYRVGGPQAIAALAYGTRSIPKVDVVVGAGSRWVSLAKQEVRSVVGVPAAFAGPSEVVVVADGTVPAACAAIDVIVQAEHGPDGLSWLVTWSKAALDEINALIAEMVAEAPRRSEIESTLAAGGYGVLVSGPEQAMAVANEIAPEHLELCCEDPRRLLPLVRNAGAVFLGPYSPASLGDYVAGPSHVLPTFRSARFASVLGVEDFLRRVHVIEASPNGLARLAPSVEAIAEAEGLFAHARSVGVREELRSERV